MTNPRQNARRSMLICGAAVAAVLAATPALAQDQIASIDISAQPMASALKELARQSGANLLFSPEAVKGLNAPAVQTSATPEAAARMLLAGTDLFVKKDSTDSLLVTADPQSGSAAGDGADGTVAALIVTAQKKEENVQDVPIAISAFTEKTLEEQKIEGGFDLLKAIPNVTFSKNNFTSYNFSIRGVGTKAVSATTDPGVAVSFNNIALLQNRLFEQEYFDVERVEVLRGPQGTLYGRNATAGVINVISAKPDMGEFKGWLKGEVGNYHAKRLSAMINVPLVEDKLAIRFAGALTDRQGYDFNATTGNPVNGRDLWSGRVTVGFRPTDSIRANLVWERFREDDNRSRTGKQLCHRDDGPTEIGGVSLNIGQLNYTNEQAEQLRRAYFSQGCKPGSLYDDAAFGTPNGLSYNFIAGVLAARGLYPFVSSQIGYDPDTGRSATIIRFGDPYGGKMQSRDLREISSIRDPKYRAKADVLELNLEFDLTDDLTFFSQTAYDKDETFSFQDFNRFNTEPVFTDTSRLLASPSLQIPSVYHDAAPGGVFCDPQIGCSNTIAGFDIAQASAKQFSQEFRLQSDFEGPFNFSLGANYTKFDALVDYYVFFNVITAMAETGPFNVPAGSWYSFPSLNPTAGDTNAPFDPTICAWGDFLRGIVGGAVPVPTSDPNSACPYVDPNPIDFSKNFDGEGHNYFRSKNPYGLKSWAAFGETYWDFRKDMKLTLGLRYTDDRKTFVKVPSQILLAPSYLAGGTVSKGYPEAGEIKQKWGEWTGRAVLDWKPDLPFTDNTLVYTSYSRGYKGGGANPPRPGFATDDQLREIAVRQGLETFYDFLDQGNDAMFPVLEVSAAEYGDTFDPEFVNAYEIGTKNTMLSGAMTFNATAFYYDYKDYQVSQIRDRTAVNENFDATMWGLEFETMFAPTRNLQIVANLGYLDTRIADGEKSIDIMNRTQSDPYYTLVKPWAQLPSNCVVPTHVVVANLNAPIYTYVQFCGVGGALGVFMTPPKDPDFGNTRYDPANYPDLNGGAGLYADLGGNELPNAPHWTMNLGAQYGHDILDGEWRATVRADAYWQSQSWARVYNDNPYDKLHGWYNVNLSIWLERPEDDLKIEFYAKNLLDKSPITDAFLNSDDTGLTTNVFTLDPRLIGLSIKKGF